MSERNERRVLLVILAIGLALRVGFAITLPPFQAPDERAHFGYVKSLIEGGTLPVQPDLSPAEALAGWPQSYQPPLAYIAFAPIASASRALGAGPRGQLRILRLQNALYGALLVAVVYGIARRLRPVGDPLRLLAPIFVACLPGLASNAGSLNNDALANLSAAGLWIVWLSAAPGPRRAVGVGALFAAACLIKLTAAALAPLLLLVPWLQRRDLPAALREACIAGAVALLLLLPWMARNVALYGDPLAVGAGSFAFEELAATLPPELLEEARAPAPGKALLQLFGRFGITNNLSHWIVPALWLPLAATGLAGWLRTRSADGAQDATRSWPAGFAAAVALASLGLTAFSLRFYGAWQGRYLYIAVAPLMLLLAEGSCRWLRRGPGRPWILVACIALALCAVDLLLLRDLEVFFETTPHTLWGRRTCL